MKERYEQIPIFPLAGVIFFPETNLPLNIFEERYLEMVNYALSKNKIIGMVQTMEKSDKLYTVGCFGKITSYNETDDGRYIINLLGVERFKIVKEIKTLNKFRIFNIKNDKNIEEDLKNKDQEEFDKSILLKKFQNFFRKTDPDLKFKSIDKISYSDLIKLIAMTCPFKVSEKQMLLESNKMSSLKENLLSLFEFYLNENSKLDTIN